jgi:valyl-tRNA synthetase
MHDYPWGDEYKAKNEDELCLEQAIGSRVLFTTKGGFVGTCIPDAQPGDVLDLWFSSPMPFVLRATVITVSVEGEDKETHSLVGAFMLVGSWVVRCLMSCIVRT